MQHSIFLEIINFEQIFNKVKKSFLAYRMQLNTHFVKFPQVYPKYAHFGVGSSLCFVKNGSRVVRKTQMVRFAFVEKRLFPERLARQPVAFEVAVGLC